MVGKAVEISFPDILFDTEMLVAVPLSFFTHKNLQYINKHLGSIDMVKANLLHGAMKGLHILDIMKVLALLSSGLSLSCSLWSQATWQMYRFQQEHNTDGSKGKFSQWYYDHFNFFETQADQDKQYKNWKVLELELHEEFCNEKCAYSAEYHVMCYDIVKSKAKTLERSKARMDKKIAALKFGKLEGLGLPKYSM